MSRVIQRYVIWSFFAKKTWVWCVLVYTVFAAILSGCTSDPPLSENAMTFREETLEGLEDLTLKLIPALERDGSFETAGEVIKDYLQNQFVNGRHVLSLGVLDPSANYLVGYRLDDTTHGSTEKSGYEDMSFASFKGVDRVVSSKKIVQMPLYFQKQRVLVVGAPLVMEDRLLAIICLSFDKEKFEKEWGISEQEFLKINFNIK